MKIIKKFSKYSNVIPYLCFLIVFGILFANPISQHTFFSGFDSVFHMNQYYDTAEQWLTRKFNPLLMLFGFNRAGRIVNSLYGTGNDYLCGLLLAIIHNWFLFQVALNLLIWLIGCSGMYKLLRYNHSTPTLATIISLCFALSYSMLNGLENQVSNSVNVIWLPWVLLVGCKIINETKLPKVSLAVILAIIFQTHLLTTIYAVVILVPLYIYKWVKEPYKLKLFKSTITSLGLLLILTTNVWFSFLVIVIHNNLLPVFPTLHTFKQIQSFKNGTFTFIPTGLMILLILAVIFILIKIRHVSILTLIIVIEDGIAIWLSSIYFPWIKLSYSHPTFTNTMQFPIRFMPIVDTLSWFLVANFFIHILHNRKPAFTYMINLTLFSLILCPMFISDNHNVNTFTAQMKTSKHLPVSYLLNRKKYSILNHHFDSYNLSYSIQHLNREIPDYLPLKHPLINYKQYWKIDHGPYNADKTKLIQPTGFHKQAIGCDKLLVTWKQAHHKEQSVPLIAYHETRISNRNDQKIPIKKDNLGIITVNAHKGTNEIRLSIENNDKYVISYLITLVGWLFLLIRLILIQFNKIN